MYITSTTTRQFFGETIVATVKTNGGSVLIEVEHVAGSGTWVTSDTITSDYAGPLTFGRASVRFTPSGGATMNLNG